MVEQRSALRVLQEALRSLEDRAVARRRQQGQPHSRREAVKVAKNKYHADPSLDGQRLSDWLATGAKNEGRAPKNPDRVWAVVQVWSYWAGEQPDQQYWNRLVEDAQPAPTKTRLVNRLESLRGTDSSEPIPQTESDNEPGRPIKDCNPIDLGVHPTSPATTGDIDRWGGLPTYVRRSHDEFLAASVAAAATGKSQVAVLVGHSSTGKTRACWEAIQPLADAGWRLWDPLEHELAGTLPSGVGRIGPRIVLWLNDAHYYFGVGAERSERMAAALISLLKDSQRAPILILVTLRTQYAERYLISDHERDEGPQMRLKALLANRMMVPNRFDETALAEARALAQSGDSQLGASLRRAGEGRVTQDLAGCPELVDRYRLAQPASRALLEAAMDARRLGVGLQLPRAFLERAAEGYMTDEEFDAQSNGWFEHALADLARPVHGDLAPLRRIRPRRSTSLPERVQPGSTDPSDHPEPPHRLADYLEDLGHYERSSMCPPSSFWKAAHDHIADAEEIAGLATEALRRYRLSWAFYLQGRSGLCPPSGNGVQTYTMRMRETAGDHDGVDSVVRREAEAGNVWALLWMAARSEAGGDSRGAEMLLAEAANTGHPGAISRLLTLRELAGDEAGVSLLRGRLEAAWRCDARMLPRMILRKGPAKAFAHGDSLAPYTGYLWVEPHGPTAWGFSKDGEPIPIEYCASLDGIPLIVAFHSGDPDAFRVAEGLLAGSSHEDWWRLFISPQSITAYDADGYRQLEALAQAGSISDTTKTMARRCADAGAFRESFFSDELDADASKEYKSWIIERVTKWWPYGLDSDGTPSGPW